MKKFVSILAAMSMVSSLALAGCSSNSPSSSSQSSSSGASSSSAQSSSDESKAESMKIALLLTGNLGDMSFLDSANAGVEAIAAKYDNVETKVIEMGADSSKYESNLLDASDADYDIIIGSGWQMQEPIQNVAQDYPDKKYIIFDAAVDYTAGDYSNVYSVSYKQNEASFLAGVMAAKLSTSNRLGFLGGMDGAVINDFLLGYIEGAQYVTPDIKVSVAYVGSYVDSTKCKEMALAQYNQGADLIFTAAGQAGLGTLDAAKEKGLFAIGVDSDQAMIFKDNDADKANLIPASVMKRVDNSLVRAIDLEMNGELRWGEEESLGLAEGAVGLSENEFYEKNVPQDVRDLILEVSDKIVSGELKVNSAFGKETSEITDIINSVK